MAFIAPVFAAMGTGMATALTVGSGLLSAVGAIGAANADAGASRYNAAIQDQQAKLESVNAVDKSTEIARRTAQKSATIRAGAAENGFSADGSVSDILQAVQVQGELEKMTALYDGSMRARNLRQGAVLDRSRAKNSKTAGILSAVGIGIDTANDAYGG